MTIINKRKNETCPDLSRDGACNSLDIKCIKTSTQKQCSWFIHSKWFAAEEYDTEITKKLKKGILINAKKNWQNYRRGARNMTARPFEDELKLLLDTEFQNENITVTARKKQKMSSYYNPNIDIILTKKNYPTSYLHLKTYLGSGEFRDCFSNIYFTKQFHNNSKGYIVTIHKQIKKLEEMLELTGGIIDGIYCLLDQPNIDDLVKELKAVYSITSAGIIS